MILGGSKRKLEFEAADLNKARLDEGEEEVNVAYVDEAMELMDEMPFSYTMWGTHIFFRLLDS